jgi:hypothetical protein
LRPLIPYLESFGFLDPEQRIQASIDPAIHELLKTLDTDLFETFETFKIFCLHINHAAETNSRFPTDVLACSMVAIQYRLLNMRFPDGTVDETIRLGLLAFSSVVFLKWKDVTLKYNHITEAYRRNLLNLMGSNNIPSALMLWLLVVGSISLFTEEARNGKIMSALRTSLQYHGLESWQDLKTSLNATLWIDFIHIDNSAWNRILQ